MVKKRVYSENEREKILAYAKETSLQEAANKFDMPVGTIYHWAKYHKGNYVSKKKQTNTNGFIRLPSPLDDELISIEKNGIKIQVPISQLKSVIEALGDSDDR